MRNGTLCVSLFFLIDVKYFSKAEHVSLSEIGTFIHFFFSLSYIKSVRHMGSTNCPYQF